VPILWGLPAENRAIDEREGEAATTFQEHGGYFCPLCRAGQSDESKGPCVGEDPAIIPLKAFTKCVIVKGKGDKQDAEETTKGMVLSRQRHRFEVSAGCFCNKTKEEGL
jgi:hypothetical protein